MKENFKIVNVAVTGLTASVVILSLLMFFGFKSIARSIEDKAFGSSYFSPDVIISKDINNKDFLTGYEASEYLGISYEALITSINNGSYNGTYTKEVNELDITYIFPREDLKNWFNDYIKT